MATSPLSPGKSDNVSATCIDAVPAENTVTLCDFPFPHKLFHRKAHGADSIASTAGYAFFSIGFYFERGHFQQLPQLSPQYHKGRHPANGVAGCPSSEYHGQAKEEENDISVYNGIGETGERNAPFGLIEEIGLVNPAGPTEQKENHNQPGNPDKVFDPGYAPDSDYFAATAADHILQGSGRTDP